MNKLVLLSLAAGGLALAACQQPVPPTVGCDFTPMLKAMTIPGPAGAIVSPIPGTMTEVPLNTVSMTDLAITNKVLLQSTTARRTETGNIEVAARMVNCTDFPLQVEGRTHFFDATQGVTEPVSAWQRVYLPARSIGQYREVSTSGGRGANFLVELREGH